MAVEHPQTRIFMLTDGQVDDRDRVIKKSKTGKDNVRIHTFGIGNGCDADMVKQMANKGRGSCSLVGDADDNLNGLVVTALARAIEPSLADCKLVFGDKTENIGELFRNQLVTRTKIISRQKFEELKLTFTCSKDPITLQPINMSFESSHFDRVEEGFGLFTLAAREQMSKESSQALELSLKYQVLCDQTAFVGVVKQKDKATGEMIDFNIEFGKNVHSEQVQATNIRGPAIVSRGLRAKCAVAAPQMLMKSAVNMRLGSARAMPMKACAKPMSSISSSQA